MASRAGGLALLSAAACALGCGPGEPSRERIAALSEPLVWEVVDEITPPELASFLGFGQAIAVDGDTAIITECFGTPGKAYAYERADGVWTLVQELVRDDEEPLFGISVALEGDTALIGAPGADNSAGRVYVYRRDAGRWGEPEVLLPNQSQSPNTFGASVALAGDVAAVGVLYGNSMQGTVQLFRRAGDIFSFEQELLAPHPENLGQFGFSVALRDGMLVVGAPGIDAVTSTNVDVGGVYVFTDDGTSWTGTKFLQPAGLTSKHRLGTSVAVDEEYVVAGAPGEPFFGGKVLVYRHADMWASAEELPAPPDLSLVTQFGAAVELAGAYIVVSAPAQLTSILLGRVYVYEQSGGVWQLSQTIVHDDTSSGDLFGDDLAASGGMLLASAPSADGQGFIDAGTVYVLSLGSTLGEPCSDDAACNSGHCADSVCCEQSCGVCQTCDTQGTCHIVAAGDDPADECAEQPVASCGLSGSCDGRGSCARFPDGASCGAGVCTGGKCRPDCLDEGTLVVLDEQGDDRQVACAPYRCSDGSCATSCQTTAECLPGFVCTIDHACVAARAANVDHSGCRAASGRERAPWALMTLALALALRRRNAWRQNA